MHEFLLMWDQPDGAKELYPMMAVTGVTSHMPGSKPRQKGATEPKH
jgi:hypothetical protein